MITGFFLGIFFVVCLGGAWLHGIYVGKEY